MLKRPVKCTGCGEYKCSIPMPLNGRVHDIDFCVADIIAALNAGGIKTVASCCGHGDKRLPMRIDLEDGRVLHVLNTFQEESGQADDGKVVKCRGCGTPYREFGLDLALPDQQWSVLAPDCNILCPSCICKRAEKLGGTVVHAWIDNINNYTEQYMPEDLSDGLGVHNRN